MIHAMDCIVTCMRPEMALKPGFSPSEPIICALKGTVTEGFNVPKTMFTK